MRTTMLLAVAMMLVTLVAPSAARAEATGEAGPVLAEARDRALEEILTAARSDDPLLRANAIEAMQPLPERALPLAQLGLEDEHPVVRFVALVTIGRLKLDELGESAARLRDDPSPSVRAAAIFAARACGEEVDLTPLAELLASQEPTVRANVAMLLGLLGDPSAVPMLEDMARLPMPRASAVKQALVRIQVAEAMVRLGDDSALDALRAGAFSQFDEVRVLSVQSMGKLKDQRMLAAIESMLADPPIELQLAAAEALARMGSPVGLKAMLAGAESELDPVRAQSAFALGLVNDVRAAEALVGLLNDPSPQVRLSAAASILRANARASQ